MCQLTLPTLCLTHADKGGAFTGRHILHTQLSRRDSLFPLSLSTAASKSRRVANWVSCSHEGTVKRRAAHIETAGHHHQEQCEIERMLSHRDVQGYTVIGRGTAITVSSRLTLSRASFSSSPLKGRRTGHPDRGTSENLFFADVSPRRYCSSDGCAYFVVESRRRRRPARRFSSYHRSLFLSSPATSFELVLSTSIRDGASKHPLGSRNMGGLVNSRSRLMAGCEDRRDHGWSSLTPIRAQELRSQPSCDHSVSAFQKHPAQGNLRC